MTLCRFQVAVSPGVQRESGTLEIALARNNEQTQQVTIGFDFAGIVGPCMALSMLGIPYTLLWASEMDESCRKMLRTHWQSRGGGVSR